MSCDKYTYQGLGDCSKLFGRAKAVIVTDRGVTASRTDYGAFAANKTLISGVGVVQGFVIDLANGVTRTSDDPEITTSNLNRKVKTQNSTPSMQGFGSVSACDYKTLFGMEGKNFEVKVLMNDGTMLGTNMPDGTVKGFSGRLSFRYDLPADDPQQSFPIDFFFNDSDEFKDFFYTESEFTLQQLLLSLPRGITLSPNTAYTAGVVLINSVIRCSKTPFSGFAASSNWRVVSASSGAIDATVTVATAANGVNTVTIKKTGGTVDLVSGDIVYIQGFTDDTTYETNNSDVFKVVA